MVCLFEPLLIPTPLPAQQPHHPHSRHLLSQNRLRRKASGFVSIPWVLLPCSDKAQLRPPKPGHRLNGRSRPSSGIDCFQEAGGIWKQLRPHRQHRRSIFTPVIKMALHRLRPPRCLCLDTRHSRNFNWLTQRVLHQQYHHKLGIMSTPLKRPAPASIVATSLAGATVSETLSEAAMEAGRLAARASARFQLRPGIWQPPQITELQRTH